MNKTQSLFNLSRRDFLKILAAAGAFAMMARTVSSAVFRVRNISAPEQT